MPWRFFSGVTFVLFCFVFRLYAFVEAAALRSIVLRYAVVPIATCVSFFFFFLLFCCCLFIWRCRFFRVYIRFLFVMESTSYVLSFRMVFFLPCDLGLDFFTSAYVRIQSINQSIGPGRRSMRRRYRYLVRDVYSSMRKVRRGLHRCSRRIGIFTFLQNPLVLPGITRN